MANNQYIGVSEAARMKDMGVALMHYHIRKGNAPEPDHVVGNMRFWTVESIDSWEPVRKRKRVLPR